MRTRRARSSKNKQYVWASSIDTFDAIVGSGAVVAGLLVSGGSDVDTRAAGGFHANIQRCIVDIGFYPHFLSFAETVLIDPVSSHYDLWYVVMIQDADDNQQYDPISASTLSDERILAHGIVSTWHHFVQHANGADPATASIWSGGETNRRIDVKSNRRITSDENLWLYMRMSSGAADSGVQWSARTLLKIPT